MHSPTHRPEKPDHVLHVTVGGREWRIRRAADLESLWEAMGGEDDPFAEDERLPYWTEIWPSSLALADWLTQRRADLAGRACLDLGCGLGLTALVAARLGARVIGMDYEFDALRFARANGLENANAPSAEAPAAEKLAAHEPFAVSCPDPADAPPHGALPLWALMDWRAPAVRAGSLHRVWGADIMYERRFATPVAAFLDHALAQPGPDGKGGGAAWIAEPGRTGFDGFVADIREQGWHCERVHRQMVRAPSPDTTPQPQVLAVVWEIRRP